MFNACREELISDIERCSLVLADGSEQGERATLEAVRRLHALLSIKGMLSRPLVAEQVAQNKINRE